MRVEYGEININKISGASFCQVDKIKQFIQDIEVIIEGYQWWNGDNPNLIKILEISNRVRIEV